MIIQLRKIQKSDWSVGNYHFSIMPLNANIVCFHFPDIIHCPDINFVGARITVKITLMKSYFYENKITIQINNRQTTCCSCRLLAWLPYLPFLHRSYASHAQTNLSPIASTLTLLVYIIRVHAMREKKLHIDFCNQEQLYWQSFGTKLFIDSYVNSYVFIYTKTNTTYPFYNPH